jgi:hypothetical protein
MSERLTVVFDDDTLYRRLKVRAAQEGTPLKRLIEDAVRAYLGEDQAETDWKPVDWEAFDRWMDEAAARDAEVPAETPNDLSDVKKHLYGRGQSHARGPLRMLAEEQTPYDAR